MKNKFSNAWKSSKSQRKQRKYRYNAPLHIKRKMMAARLSKDLQKKHNVRTLPVRTGDKVKIMRGQYTGTYGKIESIDLQRERIFIEGTGRTKTDGTNSLYPIHPSNVMIQDLNLDDKRRKMIIERKGK